LQTNGEMRISTAKPLMVNNAVIPKLYILIKTHKIGYPGRPVVSTVGSVLYPMSKYLANIGTKTNSELKVQY
jgi:hypothetical protein